MMARKEFYFFDCRLLWIFYICSWFTQKHKFNSHRRIHIINHVDNFWLTLCLILIEFVYISMFLYALNADLHNSNHIGRIFQHVFSYFYFILFFIISEGGYTKIMKHQISILINNSLVVGRARCHTTNMYLVNGSLDPQSMPTWGCMPTPIVSKSAIS